VAGKVLFKHGRHPSRYGIGRGVVTTGVAGNLKAAISELFEKPISDMDFSRLLEDVALARAHPKPVGKNEMGLMMHRVSRFSGCVSEPDIEINILEAVPPSVAYEIRRKDVEAQLRAMHKIRDDLALIEALRNCDHCTFSVIDMASIDIMSDMLWERGEYTDTNGETCRTPVSIHGGSAISPAILPLGIDGLRQAIERALSAIDGCPSVGSDDFRGALARMPELKSDRGPREKTYQSVLADRCIAWWKKYGRASQRKPWGTTDTGRQSQIVSFACVVFNAAGMPLSSRRLIALLKDARRLRAQQLWEARHLTTRRRIKTKTAN
jgi:hypothetical protein